MTARFNSLTPQSISFRVEWRCSGLCSCIRCAVQIDAQSAKYYIIASFIAFGVVGLICAALSSLFGYCSAMAGVQSLNNAMYVATGNYVVVYYQSDSSNDVEASKKRANDLTERSISFHYAAIAVGIASWLLSLLVQEFLL